PIDPFLVSAHRPPRLYPDLARYTYVTPLVAHRRVLFLGDVSPDRCLPLVGLRARYVCAVDPNPEHVEAARGAGHPENLSFQSMPLGALSFRDGSFDLVLAPDLSFAETPAAAVAEAHRVLDPRGYFVAVTRNPDCPSPLTGD